jgi:hypothetical protein
MKAEAKPLTSVDCSRFVFYLSLAPCNALYCAPGNLCWPCRARKCVEGIK